MKVNRLHAAKTERGWELADNDGIFEAEENSIVYATRREAEIAANQIEERGFDELRAMEARYE